MTQPVGPSSSLLPGEDSLTEFITVLRVTTDTAASDRLGTRLDEDEKIRIETVTTPAAILANLDSADCVVSEGHLPAADLLERLATIREREPNLPFVLLASDPPQEVVDALCEEPWTDCFPLDDSAENADLLAQRIRDVVGYRRATALARRALAAVEHGSDAIAIVAPDGTVEFVNPLLARQFGAAPERLVGRSWREMYTDAEARRLESDAFPSLEDGWRWIGDCEMRRDDGTRFVAQTRIDALDDDSLVFTVSDRPADD